eukprot:5607873-Prymnesium_polylepis.4
MRGGPFRRLRGPCAPALGGLTDGRARDAASGAMRSAQRATNATPLRMFPLHRRGETSRIPARSRKFRRLLFNKYSSKHFVTTNIDNYSSIGKGHPCDRVTMAAH